MLLRIMGNTKVFWQPTDIITMKLKYSARPAGYPVRDIVSIGFTTYRRLSGRAEELSVTVPTTWQMKIHDGHFHTIFNDRHTVSLEAQFQLDVPAATPEQIRA